MELSLYAKLNCLKKNCFDIQLSVNKKLYLYLTVYMYKNGFGIKYPSMVDMP